MIIKSYLAVLYFMRPLKTCCSSYCVKALQNDELCVLGAMEGIFKTSSRCEEPPTVKMVLSRIKGDKTYQGVCLKNYDQGLSYAETHM